MKKTTVDSKISREPGWTQDGESAVVLLEDGIKIKLGNFIKFLILYEGDDEDERILEYFGSKFSVFYKLMKHVNWQNCYVGAKGVVRDEIIESLNIGDRIYDEYISKYVELNLMLRMKAGTYMINPFKVFIGDAAAQRGMCEKYHIERKRQEEAKKKVEVKNEEAV